jgi:hypothetical protein
MRNLVHERRFHETFFVSIRSPLVSRVRNKYSTNRLHLGSVNHTDDHDPSVRCFFLNESKSEIVVTHELPPFRSEQSDFVTELVVELKPLNHPALRSSGRAHAHPSRPESWSRFDGALLISELSAVPQVAELHSIQFPASRIPARFAV